ncbi:MAG: DUF5719 family protein [Acidimicrobiia bacterium]
MSATGTGASNGTGDSVATRDARPRRPRRGIVLFGIGALLIGSIVLDESSVRSSTEGSTGPSPAQGVAAISAEPTVPSPDAVSTSWYCAEGTSNADGRADETIVIASIAETRVDATITVMSGGDDPPVSRSVRLEPRELLEVPVSTIADAAEPGVVVEVVGGQAIVSHELVGQDDVAVEPCARAAAANWYFANGTTVRGAQQFIVLFNPFGDDAIVDVTFLTDTGAMEPDLLQGYVVPRRSRVTLAVHDIVERQELVAAHVHARVGRVVAERTQLFDGSASEGVPLRKGIGVSLGAVAPERVWELPYGESGAGFAQSIGVANFGTRPTTVEILIRLDDEETIAPKRADVAAGAVVAFDVGSLVPVGVRYAVTVTARDVEGNRAPVVAELLASWPPGEGVRSVATSLGTTRTARRWVIALPDLGAGTGAVVTVLNPSTKPVTAALVVARAGDTGGPISEPEMAIPAAEFGTFAATDAMGRVLVVNANGPVVVSLTIVGNSGASASPGVPDPLARG